MSGQEYFNLVNLADESKLKEHAKGLLLTLRIAIVMLDGFKNKHVCLKYKWVKFDRTKSIYISYSVILKNYVT